MSLKCTMVLGNCLEVMPTLPAQSACMVFADLPFVCTQSKWDIPVDLASFWSCIRSSRTSQCQTVLSASLKFALELIASNRREYRYDLIFNKYNGSGFLQAKKMPLRHHELLLLFANQHGTYNPQMTENPHPRRGEKNAKGTVSETWGYEHKRYRYVYTGYNYPKSILPVMGDARTKSVHPAQKPVALLDWLIRTYSNADDTILDPCSGSGTTAVSAIQNGRHVTCIEKDSGYYEVSLERVRKHVRDNNINAVIEERR